LTAQLRAPAQMAAAGTQRTPTCAQDVCALCDRAILAWAEHAIADRLGILVLLASGDYSAYGSAGFGSAAEGSEVSDRDAARRGMGRVACDKHGTAAIASRNLLRRSQYLPLGKQLNHRSVAIIHIDLHLLACDLHGV